MKKQFENLIQHFCTLCAIDDAKSVAAGAPIDIDGVTCSLVYSEATAPDRIMVFSDYGPAPAGREGSVYRALLEANLFVYDTDTAVFSVSPEHGHVLCAARFVLADLRAEELRAALTRMSQAAREWRGHYLDPEKPLNKVPADSGGMAAKLAARFKADRP